MGRQRILDKKYTKDRNLILGENDLLTWCKENSEIGQDIVEEWITEKNGAIENYKPGSNKRAYFKCKHCGAVYTKVIRRRVLGGIHEPCGRKIGKEKSIIYIQEKNKEKNNTLNIQNSDLLNEWDYIKNNEIGLYPECVSSGSIKRAHWICSICGNHYTKKIKFRTQYGWGCLKCNPPAVGRKKKTSDRKKGI